MSLKKFLFYAFLQYLVLAFLKVWFFNHQVLANQDLQNYLFWAITLALSVALIRRFGIINYLEAFFAGFIWIAGDCLLDLIITSKFTTLSLFSQKWYWVSYIVMALGVVIWHKKKHIHRRHELRAKAHAAAHPHPTEHKH